MAGCSFTVLLGMNGFRTQTRRMSDEEKKMSFEIWCDLLEMELKRALEDLSVIRGLGKGRSIRQSFLVDQISRSIRRHSQRAEQQIALEDVVDLDLPIVSYETPSVRRHDLDLATLVSEPGRRGHPAFGVDVKIRRLLRHRELLMPMQLVE